MKSNNGKFVVANAVSYLDKTQGSCQLSNEGQNDRMDLYLKLSIVSLRSAMLHNPGIDAALVVNFEIPKDRCAEIEGYGISVHRIIFSKFRMPDCFPWGAAFFKLEVLAYLTEKYEHIALIDCDTFTVGNFDDMKKESENTILLYDVQHKLSHPDRQRNIQNHHVLFSENLPLIHYGGEIIVGSQNNLRQFLEYCEDIIKSVREKSSMIDNDMGDEQIISSAASRMTDVIQSANCYLYRYWTSNRFRLLSTNYEYNAVDIWHLPSEKENGFMFLYESLARNGEFPSRKKCVRIFGLNRQKAGRISEKIRRFRNRTGFFRWFASL